jgi:uncharacterized membrane protein YcaP (DUF421 family)
MDQSVVNIIFAVASFLAAFVFYQIMQRLQRSEDKIESLTNALPKEYVQKGDYKEDMREIKELLRQIFDKLDSKQDKGQQG